MTLTNGTKEDRHSAHSDISTAQVQEIMMDSGGLRAEAKMKRPPVACVLQKIVVNFW